MKRQCQIVIHKVADKFSQEHFAFFQVISGSDWWAQDHNKKVLDVHILCSWSAGKQQAQHLKIILFLYSNFMLHALWNQIYQSCPAQVFSVPSRLVKLHCATVEFSCFANMTQICDYTGILQKIIEKIYSLNLKVLTFFTVCNHWTAKDMSFLRNGVCTLKIWD